jgi:hypothetical protein
MTIVIIRTSGVRRKIDIDMTRNLGIIKNKKVLGIQLGSVKGIKPKGD